MNAANENAIEHQESPRTHYTRIPHSVDDMNLTPYAYRLYGHFRRVAGETGACWQSTATLAKVCRMSAGSISNHKRELTDAGLILVEERHNEQGQFHHITIVDIWRANAEKYGPIGSSSGELGPIGSSPGETPTPRGSSPGETKKNHESKKNHSITPATLFPLPEPPPKPNDGRAWFLALTNICQINLTLATETQKKQLGQSSKMLKKAGTTPEQIDAFAPWWYEHDWRGQRGQAPTPAQVREDWGQFTADGGGHMIIEM